MNLKKGLRAAAAAVFFFIFGAGCVVLIVISLFMRPFTSPEKRRRIQAALIKRAWQLFIRLAQAASLIRIRISKEDRETLGALSGTAVAANHPSLIDVMILVCLVNRPLCVVKGGLLKNFLIAPVISGVYLSNSLSAEELIRQGDAALKDGYNLIVFPEGTRSDGSSPVKLHRGLAHIAFAGGHPVQPVHISQTEKILGKGQRWYNAGERCVEYRVAAKPLLWPGGTARTFTREIKISIEK